jgi:uncharacterized membrane protein
MHSPLFLYYPVGIVLIPVLLGSILNRAFPVQTAP